MQAKALIEIIRTDYLHDVGNTPLWGDEFMLRSLTEAERQACNRQDLLFDDSTQEFTEIYLQNGVSTYEIPQKVTRIEYMGFEGNKVTQLSKHDIERTDATWRTLTGVKDKPVSFVARGHKVKFTPSPLASKDATFTELTEPASGMVTDDTWWDTTNDLLYLYDGATWILDANASLGTVSLEVFRLPECNIIGLGSAPEISEEYHRDLIWWVLHEAYKKQDADRFDQERSDYFLGKFTEVFGEYISAEVRLNKMQQERSMRLRPTAYTTKLTRSTSADDWSDL